MSCAEPQHSLVGIFEINCHVCTLQTVRAPCLSLSADSTQRTNINVISGLNKKGTCVGSGEGGVKKCFFVKTITNDSLYSDFQIHSH